MSSRVQRLLVFVAGCFVVVEAVHRQGKAANRSDASRSDVAIVEHIDKLRQAAAGLRIDGITAEWAPFYTGDDPEGDAGGDTGRDIVRAAIAPTADALCFMIATAGKPSAEDLAFWVNVDFFDYQTDDFQVGLSWKGTHTFWVFRPDREAVSGTIQGIEYAIGDVVEACVPNAALAKSLPSDMAQRLTGKGVRPWLRVSPLTWNVRTRAFVDYGPAVASYRLDPTPFALDAPRPAAGKAPRSVPLALEGRWYVGQGAYGAWSHQEAWGYDLYQVDDTMHPSSPRESRRNEDYLSWGKPVFCPAAATVIRTKSDAPDNLPRGENDGTPVNEVYLDLGDNVALWLAHFRFRGVDVVVNQQLEPGARLGIVGNSGAASWPHLHMGFWRLPEGRMTLPMALSDVRVSLNPSAADPWSRDLAIWEIREGLFVEGRLKSKQ